MGLFAGLIGGALGLIGASKQASSARKAASAQERATERQIEYAEDSRDLIFDRMDPFYRSGQNALAAYQHELGLGAAPPGYQGFTATPGYQFRLDEGTRAIEGSAAARGGLFSGRTMQALQNYGQNTASAEYGNHLARLAGLTDTGMGAASGVATAATNANAAVNSALGAQGAAQSAGHIAQGNAWNTGMGNALGAWGYMQAMNQGNNQPLNAIPALGQTNTGWWN